MIEGQDDRPERERGNIPLRFRDAALETLDSKWRDAFVHEVEDNNFVVGGKPLLVVGPGATDETMKWVACLLRAAIDGYRTSILEIIYRMKGQRLPGDDDAKVREFEQASTLVISDFSTGAYTLDAEDQALLYWFIREAVFDGTVVVIPIEDGSSYDLAMYGEPLAEFIEAEFEAIRNDTATHQKEKLTKKRRTTPLKRKR